MFTRARAWTSPPTQGGGNHPPPSRSTLPAKGAPGYDRSVTNVRRFVPTPRARFGGPRRPAPGPRPRAAGKTAARACATRRPRPPGTTPRRSRRRPACTAAGARTARSPPSRYPPRAAPPSRGRGPTRPAARSRTRTRTFDGRRRPGTEAPRRRPRAAARSARPRRPAAPRAGRASPTARSRSQAAQQLPLVLGMRHHHPAFTGRDLLVRIEAEHGRDAVPADRPPLVLGTQSLRSVLDQRQPVPLADRADLVELARVPEHVDRDDRLRPLGDRSLDRCRVEIQRPPVDVREHRRGALEDEAVRRRHERDRRRDRFVARPQARRACEQVKPRRAARDRGRVRRPDPLRDERLEPVDRRPERKATRPQHLQDELLLPLVQQRTGERYRPEAGAQASAGAGVAYSSHWAQRSLRPRAVSR